MRYGLALERPWLESCGETITPRISTDKRNSHFSCALTLGFMGRGDANLCKNMPIPMRYRQNWAWIWSTHRGRGALTTIFGFLSRLSVLVEPVVSFVSGFGILGTWSGSSSAMEINCERRGVYEREQWALGMGQALCSRCEWSVRDKALLVCRPIASVGNEGANPFASVALIAASIVNQGIHDVRLE